MGENLWQQIEGLLQDIEERGMVELYKDALLREDWRQAHDVVLDVIRKWNKRVKGKREELVVTHKHEQSYQETELLRKEEDERKVNELLRKSEDLVQKLRSSNYIIHKKKGVMPMRDEKYP